jgi:hypothetical protein
MVLSRRRFWRLASILIVRTQRHKLNRAQHYPSSIPGSTSEDRYFIK